MTKKKRTRTRQRKRKRKDKPTTAQPPATPAAGLHALVPGEAPTAEMLEEMTRVYQAQIRSQPGWAHVVQALGEAEAERLLAQCRVELG